MYDRGLQAECGSLAGGGEREGARRATGRSPPPAKPPLRPHGKPSQMKLYPQELKDRLIVRKLAPNRESVPALAQETQIPRDTLFG